MHPIQQSIQSCQHSSVVLVGLLQRLQTSDRVLKVDSHGSRGSSRSTVRFHVRQGGIVHVQDSAEIAGARGALEPALQKLGDVPVLSNAKQRTPRVQTLEGLQTADDFQVDPDRRLHCIYGLVNI